MQDSFDWRSGRQRRSGGSKQSGAATSSDALEEIVVTAKRIGNNPTDSILDFMARLAALVPPLGDLGFL